ncbi:MAG: NAD(P)/FAD-dependent oxidoreductase [Pseudomonadota bacterium]
MTRQYDAIIVGGGHNGLTCGAYLSRAGVKTLVLEQKHIIGGAAVTEEFYPGFRASTYSFIMGHLHPKVISELELFKYGLDKVEVPDVINPTFDNDCIVFTKDPVKNQQQIARFSKKDAEVYPQFFEYLTGAIDILRRLQLETPFDPTRHDLKNLIHMAKFAWRFRNVGKDLYRIVDVLSMSAYDYVSQWFETDIVKAKFLYWATIGGNVGPYSPGTAFYLVAHLIGQTGMSFTKGGMGSISEAIAASGREHGMEVEVSSPVDEVLVRNNRAYGVRLASGEEVHGKMVISNVNVKTTFDRLVDETHLPADFLREVRSFRAKGSSFKILCAVDSLPEYSGFDPEKTGTEYPAYAHIAPSCEYLERAFDEAKYGWYSSQPFLSPIVPSYWDESLAPAGKHVVSLYGGVAPYELKNASWDDERENLVKNAFAVMDRFAPGFSDKVIGYKTYLPPDIEADIGMPGGNTQHGDLTLDQMFFMRPVPGYSDYRSPVTGLFQCGASTHPGGAVSAVSGHNAAREVLKDWRKLKR